MVSDDPATETWRETLGLSTSAQLRQTQRDLAASQADLTHAREEWANADGLISQLRADLAAAQQPCAWRDLAVDAMQERDLARAQLDDAIATFRTERSGP